MKFIFYTLFTCALIACNSNTIFKKPENLISKTKMANIIADSYIAKSAEKVRNINNDKNINYLSFIYKKHNTDSITFNESLEYYTSNISQNEEILKLVKQSLDNQLEDITTKKDSIYSYKIDSLKKAQEIITEENITELRNKQKRSLNRKIDSTQTALDELYKDQILALKKDLKDSLNIKSEFKKNIFLDSLYKEIENVNSIKKDSTDKSIELVKELHNKKIDKKIEAIKKDNEKSITKKTKILKRSKYK